MNILKTITAAIALVAAASSHVVSAQTIYQGPGTYSTYGNQTYGPSGTQSQFGNSTLYTEWHLFDLRKSNLWAERGLFNIRQYNLRSGRINLQQLWKPNVYKYS